VYGNGRPRWAGNFEVLTPHFVALREVIHVGEKQCSLNNLIERGIGFGENFSSIGERLAKLFVGTSRHHRGTVSARHNAELARDDD
jgi:hypothetical protein